MDPLTMPTGELGNQMLNNLPQGFDGMWKLGRGGAEVAPGCPRCASPNTKFCYYNNYSLSQPRYFCKSCRRYWTKGGSLRNVPVGGGCRKSRRSRAARAVRAEPLTRPLNSNSNSSGRSDDLNEHVSADVGAPEIDMATVFANFLNQSPSPGSDPDQFSLVDQDSPSTENEVDPLFVMPNEADQLAMFWPQEATPVEKQSIREDGQFRQFTGNDDLGSLGLISSVLVQGDLDESMLADGLWHDIEPSNFPSFSWQHEAFQSADSWKTISTTNPMAMGENWNSTFDISGFEILSRP